MSRILMLLSIGALLAVLPARADEDAPPPPPPPPAPPAPLAIPAPPPPPPGLLEQITHVNDDAVATQLKGMCGKDLTITFTFTATDEKDEWRVTFVDEDGDDLGYVNLDDDETIEIHDDDDAEDEDLDEDAEPGEPHEAVIRMKEDEVSGRIDGDEVVEDEEIDDYDECAGIEVLVDEGMTLTGFKVEIH